MGGQRKKWSGEGTPLRFSPVMVEIFWLDWAPRRIAVVGEAFPLLPDVLAAWIRFAGRCRGLPEGCIAESSRPAAGGTTRSGCLRALAEETLHRRSRDRAARMGVTNVALRSWQDRPAALRLGRRVTAPADGGLVLADELLLAEAATIAGEHDISVYDAACVAAARAADARLVSCDVGDLVARRLADFPRDALT